MNLCEPLKKKCLHKQLLTHANDHIYSPLGTPMHGKRQRHMLLYRSSRDTRNWTRQRNMLLYTSSKNVHGTRQRRMLLYRPSRGTHAWNKTESYDFKQAFHLPAVQKRQLVLLYSTDHYFPHLAIRVLQYITTRCPCR